MQENNSRCPECGKKNSMVKADRFNDKEWSGALCKRCEHFVPDVQTKRYDLSCADCAEPMPGTKSLPYQYHHKGWEQQHQEILKCFYCVDCHASRRAKGNEFSEDTFVRHQVDCSSCGNVLLWVDIDEDKSAEHQQVILERHQGTCSDECTAKANNKRLLYTVVQAHLQKEPSV